MVENMQLKLHEVEVLNLLASFCGQDWAAFPDTGLQVGSPQWNYLRIDGCSAMSVCEHGWSTLPIR
jgi:hypothetical protein